MASGEESNAEWLQLNYPFIFSIFASMVSACVTSLLPFLRLEQAFNISNFNKYNKAFKQWWIQRRQVIFYRKMAAHRKKEDKILLRTIHKFHSLIKTFNIPWYFFFGVFFTALSISGCCWFCHFYPSNLAKGLSRILLKNHCSKA